MATKEEINTKIKEREVRYLKGANFRPLSSEQIAQNRIWLQKYKPNFLKQPEEEKIVDTFDEDKLNVSTEQDIEGIVLDNVIIKEDVIEEDMQEVFDKF